MMDPLDPRPQVGAPRATREKVEDVPAPPEQTCPLCNATRWRPDGKKICLGCEMRSKGR